MKEKDMEKGAAQGKKRSTRSEAVAQRLMDAIERGEFETGSRLPSESVLAKQFQVSRATLREAFKKLEQMGTIRARQGSGTYVLYNPNNNSMSTVGQDGNPDIAVMVNELFTVNHFQVTQYLDARKAIEFSAIDLAITCMDNENLINLNNIVTASELPSCTVEDYHNYDCMFHRELVRASKNQFLYQFWLILEPCLRDQVSRIVDKNAFGASRQMHRQIFEAILHRDKKEALALMEKHYSTILGRFFLKATQISKDTHSQEESTKTTFMEESSAE